MKPEKPRGGKEMMKTYILVSLVPGLEANTLSQISSLPDVEETDLVFGRWDVVGAGKG